MTDIPPFDLDETVRFMAPDALWVTYEFHSGRCYTVNLLNVDYRYTVWRAHLSLDDRWSLSPVAGPWQNAPDGANDQEGLIW